MKIITEKKKRGRPKKNKTLIEKIESKKIFGFTLIELLAVIIILGVLMIIAIPAVTEYIGLSRKNAYVKTANQYISGARTKVNSAEIPMYDVDATYYLKSSCVSLEKGGASPFGEWEEAYIVITYDGHGYDYYWTSRDTENMGILLTDENLLDEDSVKPGITSINTDVGIEGKSKILLINDCNGADVTEKVPLKTITKDSNLEDDNSTSKPDDDPILNPEPNLENYLSGGEGPFNNVGDKSQVEEIYIVTTNKVPENAIKSWDASEQKNKSIMGWTLDEDNDGLYELYFGQEGGVIANPNSIYLFKDLPNVTKMDLRNLDTSKVTSMSGMFWGCSSLKNLDLSSFNTKNVTSMYAMFYKCNSLENLNLSNFDTSNVTSMGWMFYDCSSLTSLDVSHFNTSKVTGMEDMFASCSSLINLDVSNFDTSNVTNMGFLFSNCRSLKNIDVSNFDTSKVKNMLAMFSGCSSLTSLDVTNFDTSNVTNMNNMFEDCSELSELNIDNFDTSNVTGMRAMFRYCSKLTNINLKHFDTSKVTDMFQMFDGDSSLTTLDLSSFDTSNVTKTGYMFCNCSSLRTLDLSSFNEKDIDVNTANTTENIFYGAPANCNVKVKNNTIKEQVLTIRPNWNVTY